MHSIKIKSKCFQEPFPQMCNITDIQFLLKFCTSIHDVLVCSKCRNERAAVFE